MARFDIVVPKPEEQHFKNVKTRTVGGVKELIVKDVKDGVSLYEVGGEPVWGLGCPRGCGRFWEFTADAVDMVEETDSDGVKRKWPRAKVGSHFKPLDPEAYSGVAKDGALTNGYLNFTPDPVTPSNVKMFTCDRCSSEVKLVKQ